MQAVPFLFLELWTGVACGSPLAKSMRIIANTLSKNSEKKREESFMTQPSKKGTDGSKPGRGRFAAPVAGGAAGGIVQGLPASGSQTGQPQGGATNTNIPTNVSGGALPASARRGGEGAVPRTATGQVAPAAPGMVAAQAAPLLPILTQYQDFLPGVLKTLVRVGKISQDEAWPTSLCVEGLEPRLRSNRSPKPQA